MQSYVKILIMGKLIFGRTYKINLKEHDEVKLLRLTGITRFVRNLCLEHRLISWNQFRKSESYLSQANQLSEMKRTPGFEWLSEAPSQSLQEAVRDIDTAYQKFFKGLAKFPKPRKKGIDHSIRFPDKKTIKVIKLNKNTGLVELPKGLSFRFRFSRSIDGEIKNATIKKESNGWYISFCVEGEVSDLPFNSTTQIGIDRGITDSIVCSDGAVFNLPKTIKTNSERIKVLQKRLRKKKKFSTNWNKDQVKIRKLHKRNSNIRKDFLHKTSTHLAKNHGLIVLEDLKIKNMSKSAKGTLGNPGTNVAAKSGLNREILNQGWGMFEVMILYKTQWLGSHLALVNPKNTSRACLQCGTTSAENRSGKNFCCISCGFEADADLVGAKNILNKYTAGRAGSDCGEASISSVCEAVTSNKGSRKTA